MDPTTPHKRQLHVFERLRARQRATKNCNTLPTSQRARRGAIDTIDATVASLLHVLRCHRVALTAEGAMRSHSSTEDRNAKYMPEAAMRTHRGPRR